MSIHRGIATSDFQLKIVAKISKSTDLKLNYLVLPGSKNAKATVVLNHYKTSGNKEEAIMTIFSSKVSTLVRSYLKQKGSNKNKKSRTR